MQLPKKLYGLNKYKERLIDDAEVSVGTWNLYL